MHLYGAAEHGPALDDHLFHESILPQFLVPRQKAPQNRLYAHFEVLPQSDICLKLYWIK